MRAAHLVRGAGMAAMKGRAHDSAGTGAETLLCELLSSELGHRAAMHLTASRKAPVCRL